jgi:hypothetical protein
VSASTHAVTPQQQRAHLQTPTACACSQPQLPSTSLPVPTIIIRLTSYIPFPFCKPPSNP